MRMTLPRNEDHGDRLKFPLSHTRIISVFFGVPTVRFRQEGLGSLAGHANSTIRSPCPTATSSELRDTAAYISALPKREAEAAHWQLAIENLISTADHAGIVMLTRIAALKGA